MSDYISKLPDDIIGDLLSLLSVRDSVRARSLSYRWKDVPDYRSVLQFDSVTVFGKDQGFFPEREDEFATAVDQFLKTWGAQKPREFHLKFGLTNKHTGNINTWIAAFTSKGVDTLDLNLSSRSAAAANAYVLPCHLFHSKETPSFLRHLHLKSCITTLCSGCNSWLGSLATLELRHVTLRESDMQHILSTAVNLTSLTLISCVPENWFWHINIHLPCLKKLVINLHAQADINCPCLETLDYTSYFCPDVTFSHFPFLTQVYLRLHCRELSCSCSSKVVDHFTTNAPKLQYFFQLVTSAVPPPLARKGMRCLKTLHLFLFVPLGFDLFTITDVLHASPSLETIHLEVNYDSVIKRSTERPYLDRPHFQLKEFKFYGYKQVWKEMEFLLYLLKNAIALEQMIIVTKKTSKWRPQPKFNLLHGVHPTAELIIE